MGRVGTKKVTKMGFHEILPLDQFKSESKEFLGHFCVEFLVYATVDSNFPWVTQKNKPLFQYRFRSHD